MMNTINNIKFVKLVQLHPEIYDNRNINFANLSVVSRAWFAIASHFDLNAEQCELKWKFVIKKYYAERLKNGGLSTWSLYPHLHFLLPPYCVPWYRLNSNKIKRYQLEKTARIAAVGYNCDAMSVHEINADRLLGNDQQYVYGDSDINRIDTNHEENVSKLLKRCLARIEPIAGRNHVDCTNGAPEDNFGRMIGNATRQITDRGQRLLIQSKILGILADAIHVQA